MRIFKRLKRLKNIAYCKKHLTVDIEGKTYTFYFNYNFLQGIRNVQIAYDSQAVEGKGFRVCPLKRMQPQKASGPLPGRVKDLVHRIAKNVRI